MRRTQKGHLTGQKKLFKLGVFGGFALVLTSKAPHGLGDRDEARDVLGGGTSFSRRWHKSVAMHHCDAHCLKGPSIATIVSQGETPVFARS